MNEQKIVHLLHNYAAFHDQVTLCGIPVPWRAEVVVDFAHYPNHTCKDCDRKLRERNEQISKPEIHS